MRPRSKPKGGVGVWRRQRGDLVRYYCTYRPGFGRPAENHVFETRTEAEKYAAAWRVRLGVSTAASAQRPVRELLDSYLADARLRLRQGTIENYQTIVKLHLSPAVGDLQARDLTPDRIRELVGRLLTEGMKPGGARCVVGVLRAAVQPLVTDGALASNPARITRGLLPRPQRTPRAVSRDHLTAILAASRGEKYSTLLHLIALTGVRVSEALALTWADLDLDLGVARIERSCRAGQASPSKTIFSRRSVDLPAPLVAMLREDSKRATSSLVFPSRSGGYLHRGTAHSFLLQAAKKAGVPPTFPHAMRHAFATAQLRAGLPIYHVSRALGHANTAFTAATYASAPLDPRPHAADALAASLGVVSEPATAEAKSE